MGVDIYLHIVSKEGKMLHKNIFDGRSHEWFENMKGWGQGWDVEFKHWYPEYGIPDNSPEEVKVIYDDCTRSLVKGESYSDREHFGYYDFRTATVKQWIIFFEKYRPDRDAGWIRKYDAFLLKRKGIIPDEVQHYLDSDDRIEDFEWIEFDKKYDCSYWLYDFIMANQVPEDAYLVYYFG